MTASQIRALRKKLNLTQTQFAQRLGVSYRIAQYWEAKKPCKPSNLAEAKLQELAKQAKRAA